MKVNWIKGEIEPPKGGQYFRIMEAQIDTDFFKKGDVEIDFDWYSKDFGWISIGHNNPVWKVVAWADMLLPDVPEQIKDRLIKYLDVEIKK